MFILSAKYKFTQNVLKGFFLGATNYDQVPKSS